MAFLSQPPRGHIKKPVLYVKFQRFPFSFLHCPFFFFLLVATPVASYFIFDCLLPPGPTKDMLRAYTLILMLAEMA